jgi:hypothetical protein
MVSPSAVIGQQNPSDSGAGFKTKAGFLGAKLCSFLSRNCNPLMQRRQIAHSHLRQPWPGVDLGHCAAAFAVHGFGAGHGLWGQMA